MSDPKRTYAAITIGMVASDEPGMVRFGVVQTGVKLTDTAVIEALEAVLARARAGNLDMEYAEVLDGAP